MRAAAQLLYLLVTFYEEHWRGLGLGANPVVGQIGRDEALLLTVDRASKLHHSNEHLEFIFDLLEELHGQA